MSRSFEAILKPSQPLVSPDLEQHLAAIDEKIRQIKLRCAQVEFLVKEIRDSNR